MGKKLRNIVKRTAAELSRWKSAAKPRPIGRPPRKSLRPPPSGRDPDDAMEEIVRVTTEMPKPRPK
jgi:hypothetical protein